jgi:hypothetical protein
MALRLCNGVWVSSDIVVSAGAAISATAAPGEWVSVDLSTGVVLANGTRYRIIMWHPNTTGSYTWMNVRANTVTNLPATNPGFDGASGKGQYYGGNLGYDAAGNPQKNVGNDASYTDYGNTSADYSFYFDMDTTSPTAAITQPTDVQYVSSLSLLTGTVNDAGTGNGPFRVRVTSGVEICIFNNTLGQYWNGSAWATATPNRSWVVYTATNIPVGSNVTWQYRASTSSWLSHDTVYNVYARAYDASNNRTLVWSTMTFTFDQFQPDSPGPERPDSSVTSQTNGTWVKSLASITGTAVDNPMIT